MKVMRGFWMRNLPNEGIIDGDNVAQVFLTVCTLKYVVSSLHCAMEGLFHYFDKM